MSWENIEERLAASLPQQIPFPAGMVWLPPTYINVADWLSSIARTEQERKELETGAMKFLQYRWPFEVLVEMFWDDIGATISGDYKVEVMYVGNRAYVFLAKLGQPQVVAALEPANEPTLYSGLSRHYFLIQMQSPSRRRALFARGRTLYLKVLPNKLSGSA